MKVLLVEDDASVRKAIMRLLRAAGFEGIAFETAEAMLVSGQAESAGCVVSDIHLPAMSGLELTGKLRQSHTDLPTILMTAFDTPGLRERALSRGAAAYLVKPFDGTALLDIIRQVTRSLSA
jgi:FixJ family two-component response regulator